MKIKKLSNSILVLNINPKTDKVFCRFFYFVNFRIKTAHKEFDLNEVDLKTIVEVYKQIADEWSKRYRL